MYRLVKEASSEAIKEFVINALALGSPEMLERAIKENITFTKVLKKLRQLAKVDKKYGNILVLLVTGLEVGKKVIQHMPPSMVDEYFSVEKVMEFIKKERPDYYKVLEKHDEKAKKWLRKRLLELKRWLYAI